MPGWLLLDRAAYDAESRIGERGAIYFIQQGLLSRKYKKASYSFTALSIFHNHHENPVHSQEMFAFLIDYLANKRYLEGINDGSGGDISYKIESLRRRAIGYLYYGGSYLYTMENKRDLLDLYHNHLTDKEKARLLEYMTRGNNQWFLRNDPTLGD